MNVLVVYMQKNNKTLAEVLKVLKTNKHIYKTINRAKLKKPIKGYDLIITVGGDGTFLKTSHFVANKIPMLGVNADPSRKEGFFTRADANTIRRLLSRELHVKKLTRLTIDINGKEIKDYPLNEVFIGHYKPYMMSALCVEGHDYRCSGVLVSTPAGSCSWAKSAGAPMMPLFSDSFQYVLLDPYEGNVYKVKHNYKVLKKGKKVQITPLMKGCILVIDSLSKEYHVRPNQTVTVKVSKHPLYFVEGNHE